MPARQVRTPVPVPTPTPAPSFPAKVWAWIKSLLPTGKAVLKFATVIVIPPAAGFLATYLFAELKPLSALGITHNELVTYITGALILVATSGITFLTQHNVLSGKYARTTYNGVTNSYSKVQFKELLP